MALENNKAPLEKLFRDGTDFEFNKIDYTNRKEQGKIDLFLREINAKKKNEQNDASRIRNVVFRVAKPLAILLTAIKQNKA